MATERAARGSVQVWSLGILNPSGPTVQKSLLDWERVFSVSKWTYVEFINRKNLTHYSTIKWELTRYF